MSLASNKSFADIDLSVEGNESSLSDESGLAPTVTRTAARELESHLVGFRNGEELGRTRAQKNGFDGLVAVETFAEMTETPDGCYIVDAK